ncbi:autotransporter domain-containing protein [Phenylobacterium sp.]|uniref:autotransporter outer membrane beta-barrel domain-containing protein n=1 Tax=Phenylobacterium sp. TaxID=1871053 RepID=UPI00273732E9|nr:autotransporter outer membrane beta-barrel domain-containing protein [Phenylobacterium sp.]MDP3855983.1 autotransporter outer membrane beta-barrel domain-containing protein [Phenylobacterium sp.]
MPLRHVLLAAASPLCLLAGAAHAETVISDARTTAIATATAASGARDDVKVASGGSVKPTSGAAVTLNSNNNVTHEGSIVVQDADDATGVLVLGGTTGELKISGTIQVDETTEIKDTDSDGDNDGQFATGNRRFGVRVTGPQPFHGQITMTGGSIAVEGNDSAGISVETAIDGSVRTAGAITVSGDRSYGVHTVGTVGGDVAIVSSVLVQGKEAVGVAVDQGVGGKLILGNTITATGYRYTTRPADAALAKLDADDLLIGGPAVRVSGDVFGGILVDAPPPNLDANDTDEDDDGIADASESTGAITSFGTAPALLVGDSARDIRLGTGTGAYGLDIKGAVQSAGVYDAAAATGVKLGGLGGKVAIDGGIRVLGSVTADAVKANATALRLGAGASTPLIRNEGGSIKAAATSADAVDVRAIQIDAGASAAYLANSGVITAAIAGTKGSATAVLDSAGSLRLIENIHTIAATITPSDTAAVTGSRVALDLQANTAGVTVRQGANASTSITPTITGDVLFGSGAARLELLAGVLNGKVAFGSGADTLVIDGEAKMTGALTDAGGGLTISVLKGRLTATSTDTLNLTSLTLGATGELVLTADPAAGRSTLLNVAGAANVATGAKVGLRFATKLTAPTSFTLIKATSLTTGTLDTSLLGSTPWLYKADLRVDAAQNTIFADVRRRTAVEAGLNTVEASAYEAVFANFDGDTVVRDALLGKTDAGTFAGLYDQFLPDHSGGLFNVLSAASDATNRAIEEEQPLMSREGLRLWTQEIVLLVKRDIDRTSSYEADGFGLAGGVEAPDTDLGTLGLTTSFVNVDVEEQGSNTAETLGGQIYAAGVYWRDTAGGLTANLGATAGYARLKSKRVLSDAATSLSRSNEADWTGATVAVHANASYLFEAGAFFAKPQVSADYFLLKEDGRTESGGGASMDLTIDERSSSQLGAFAGVTFGARLGEESAFVWVPEVTAGWRQVSGDGVDVTTARFVAGGPTFSMAAPELSGGGPVLRLALRGQAEYFDFAIEAGGEIRDDYEAYDGRVVARFLF